MARGKIQLVGQKCREKTTLASKMRFSGLCFGFQSRRFSLLVGYNIQPSSSSTNQNAASIIDHQLDFTKKRDHLQSSCFGLKTNCFLTLLLSSLSQLFKLLSELVHQNRSPKRFKAPSRRIRIFLKPHTHLYESGSRPYETSESLPRNRIFLKSLSRMDFSGSDRFGEFV